MSNENVFIGFIKKLNSKPGTTKAGKPWIAYSVKLETKDGDEIGQWFRLGFNKPDASEGDYVKLICSEVNDKFATVESIKVSANPPERKRQAATSSTGSTGGSGYNSDEQRADRAYHAARGTAVDLISVLLEHKALPVSAAQTKAGSAKRYEEIVAAVDKLTVKYFRDEFPEFDGNFRLLGLVDDAGSIVTDPPADVPDRDDNGEGDYEFPEEEDDDIGF